MTMSMTTSLAHDDYTTREAYEYYGHRGPHATSDYVSVRSALSMCERTAQALTAAPRDRRERIYYIILYHHPISSNAPPCLHRNGGRAHIYIYPHSHILILARGRRGRST